MTEMAIYYDSSKCTACKGCQVACKCWNDLPSPTGLNENKFSGSYQNPPDLNGMTRLIMTFSEENGGSKGVQWAFGRRACQHCTDAACVSICPGGALTHNEETGFVEVDEAKCIGCQYCSSACPFDVPRYQVGLDTKVSKCTGCPDRVAQGLAPACVTTCQPEALKFGPREEMIQLANERVEWLHDHGYTDAVVYGADELGGLHVIQVLKYGIEAHGQIKDPEVPAAATLTNLMKPVTGVLTGVTVAGLAAMFALGIGYSRRKLAYNPETQDTVDADTGEVVKHGDGQDELTVKEHIFENIGKGKGGDDE